MIRALLMAAIVLTAALAGCARPDPVPRHLVAHPDRAGAHVEYYVERPAGRGPWPTVIFLHGHQDGADRIGGRAFADWGVLRKVADRGYLAVAVSLPGYGGSTGPEDFAGPFTQGAVAAVIDTLAAQRDAAPDRIVIQGVSLGAVTAALLAAHDKRIAGLVLISGLYDLPAFFANPPTTGARSVKAALDRQTGGSLQALEARSALPMASRIQAATLILNGAKDDRTDPAQAVRFAEAINAGGGQARAIVYPAFGHAIPVRVRDADVTRFIDETLKPRSADRGAEDGP